MWNSIIEILPFQCLENCIIFLLMCHSSNLILSYSGNGEVPFGAIQGGQTSSGEPLYIGRIWHKGEPCVGKIHPSHQTLYISYGGKEHHYKHGYEILCFYNRYVMLKKILRICVWKITKLIQFSPWYQIFDAGFFSMRNFCLI